MKIDLASEIRFRTARSGGKGGQNVNKVETMVEGLWNVADSPLLTEEQKAVVLQRLSDRINSEGCLAVRSRIHRTQLGNKREVVARMNMLVERSLERKKSRIATAPTKASVARRADEKKKLSDRKSDRRKIKPSDL